MRDRTWLRILAGVSLLLSGAIESKAATVRSLSLNECLEFALQRNFDLQIERLYADIAGYNLTTAYGAYSPLFSFGAKHEYVSQPGDFDPNKAGVDFPYQESFDTAGPTLTGRVPFGLDYNFGAVATARDAFTDFTSNTNIASDFPSGIRHTNNYFAEAGIRLRQHLLKDSWVDQDSTTIVLRRKDLKISEQRLRFLAMKTVLAVELAYYDLIVARENIRVQEKALELRQQLVTETRRRVQLGDLPPLDSEQAETQLQNTVTALTAAREIFVDRANALKNLLSDHFEKWADIDLQPAETLVAVPAGANRSVSSLNALKSRPDLIEARIAVQKGDAVVKFRFNQLLPSVDVIGSYGGQNIAADASDAFHLRDPFYSYGVVLSFPFSNLAERGKYHASKTDREIADLQLKKAEQSVLVEVANLVNRVGSRFSQVGSTQKARNYAEAALAAEQKKLANGLSTSFFVLQLQETLTLARTTEILALADYNKAVAQLTFAEGRTLEKYRFEMR
jgi:HAE1 family hydrophobic/amphiphilic exporter-1